VLKPGDVATSLSPFVSSLPRAVARTLFLVMTSERIGWVMRDLDKMIAPSGVFEVHGIAPSERTAVDPTIALGDGRQPKNGAPLA
jgi:hypothetical protein